MTKYIAKDGDRLDKIVFIEYGTLDILPYIISLNSSLPAILSAGDTILLPKVEISKERMVKKLW